jgi:RNA polymerase sigma-70 factor, ECF subfamily
MGVCPDPNRIVRGDATTDAGDEFRAIYERNAAHVFRFALSLGADGTEAEDITAEAFARAFTSAAPIRQETARAYLMTIARHYFLETRRRTRRETDLVVSLRDGRASPEIAAEHRAELSALGGLLTHLTDTDRTALLMRAVDDMPYEEIARALGISVGAAKVKVHRARRTLAALTSRRE